MKEVFCKNDGHSNMEIIFDGFENSFFDLDTTNISYWYWQCHQDLSVHLFVSQYYGDVDVASFYLSAWKLFLKEYNFNDGSTEEEIESVFHEDIEEMGRVLFSKISVSDFIGSELKNMPRNIKQKFFNNFDMELREFEVFKEDTDSTEFVDYIFICEKKIGLLMFI
ncbi:MAG: hypothetical protein P8171_18905 [Candidatus Thiodiazotropha sp.]